MNWTVLIFCFLLISPVTLVHGYIRGCYYTNWSQYRQGDGRFLPENIPRGLCTHVLYAFAKVDNAGNPQMFEWNDEEMYRRVTSLKQNDPGLKILLSFGGASFGSAIFTDIARSPEKTQHFIQSAIAFLRSYNFDGYDLDWEYPDGVAQEHANLVAEMKRAFTNEAATTGRERLLLTAAASAGKQKIDSGYNVQSVGRDLDLLFLMSYDLHGSWESNVDLHAKLRPLRGDEIYTTEYAANYWASKGMPREKIVIGIPTYARGWTLSDPSQTGIGAAASGAAPATQLQEPSIAAYWEICDFVRQGGREAVHQEAGGAYMVNGNVWYGYDNEESIRMKMRWLKDNGYAGAFIWALDFDDFTGAHCGKGQYPLLNTINSELQGAPGPTVPDTPTSPPITMPSTQPPPPTQTEWTVPETTIAQPTSGPNGISCPQPTGYFAHPTDCHKFIQCGNGIAYEMTCAPGTNFNDRIGNCDHLANASPPCR